MYISAKGNSRARRFNVNQVKVVMCYGGGVVGWCGVVWSMLCIVGIYVS